MSAILSFMGGAYLVHSPEFYFQDSAHDTCIFKLEYIFPLSTIQFEGYTFPSPNNPDKYLTEQFGDYMSFPREGALHHGSISRAFKRSKDNLDSHTEKIADIEKFFTSIF